MKSLFGASDLFAFFLFLNMHFFEPQKAAFGEKSRHTRAAVTRCPAGRVLSARKCHISAFRNAFFEELWRF
jgi:hypothetical protein